MLQDTDAYEKDTAKFICEVNDEDAKVKWFKEDKVRQAELLWSLFNDECEFTAARLKLRTLRSRSFLSIFRSESRHAFMDKSC